MERRTMLLRRYGNTVQSVQPHFDARALTEISFRRDRTFSLPTEEFNRLYIRVAGHELTAATSGPVQGEAEEALMDALRDHLDSLLAGLGEGEALLVESEQGVDWPKTREDRKNVIVEGENRFYFHWTNDPPLRVAVYRPVA